MASFSGPPQDSCEEDAETRERLEGIFQSIDRATYSDPSATAETRQRLEGIFQSIDRATYSDPSATAEATLRLLNPGQETLYFSPREETLFQPLGQETPLMPGAETPTFQACTPAYANDVTPAMPGDVTPGIPHRAVPIEDGFHREKLVVSDCFSNQAADPITRAQMLLLLEPLHSCLRRLEIKLEDLGKERFATVANPTKEDTGLSSNVVDIDFPPDLSDRFSHDVFSVKKTASAPPRDKVVDPKQVLQQSHDSSKSGALQSLASEDKDLKIISRFFGSMTSEKFREFSSDHMRKIGDNGALHALKRLLFRSSPTEVMDTAMSVVIVANSVAIGFSCDTKNWEQGWLVVDSIFACIFITEMTVKLYLLGFVGYFCRDGRLWHWFETMLVVLSLLEIIATIWLADSSMLNGSTLFRVVRLVRLVKILRVCRVPMASDLVMMVSGIIGGSRTLISSCLLVLFPLYVFALVMRETLGEEPDVGNSAAANFGTLPLASFNTFRCLVVDDCADKNGKPIFLLVAEYYGWAYSMMYSGTLVFLKFGLFNVIIAIFVEQTVQAAKSNATYQKRARLNDRRMFQEKSVEMAELAYSLKQEVPQHKVARALSMNEMASLELSKDEFNRLCAHPEFKELLTALDVAEEDHLDLFDTLDVDSGGTLDVGEILSGIAKLRGDARKSDVVAVLLLAKHLSRNLAEFMEGTTSALEGHRNQLSAIQQVLRVVAT